MNEEDPVLQELREAADPILTKMDQDYSAERAALVIGAVDVLDGQGNSVNVQSYMDVVGDHALIQETLYTQLVDQIEAGNPELFEALREVIHKIEEEKELSPSDTLLSIHQRVLH